MIHEQLLEIIKAPHLTEKTASRQMAHNQYVFKVVPEARKVQIKQAIEKIFNVKVTKINTLNVYGKVKRTKNHSRKAQDWKKVYVTLQDGNTIPICAVGEA